VSICNPAISASLSSKAALAAGMAWPPRSGGPGPTPRQRNARFGETAFEAGMDASGDLDDGGHEPDRLSQVL